MRARSDQAVLPDDIGLPSQLYAACPLAEALQRLALRTHLVEIHSFGLHTVLSKRNQRVARESGLRFVVHGPYGQEIDPGSPEEAVRKAAVAEHCRQVEGAAEIGASCYVVHPDRRLEPGGRDPRVEDALKRTVLDFEKIQCDSGVRVAIENMPGRGISHFTGPGDLDLGALALALDCGHAAISDTLTAFLQDPMADLLHVHLHSNAGPSEPQDPHRQLGEGIVDAAPVLALARSAGATVVLEHDDEAAVLASISHLQSRGLLS